MRWNEDVAIAVIAVVVMAMLCGWRPRRQLCAMPRRHDDLLGDDVAAARDGLGARAGKRKRSHMRARKRGIDDVANSFNELDHRPAIPLTLVMGLLSVSLRQGASIPRALDCVGETLDCSLGDELRVVARALNRGVGWNAAWTVHNRGLNAGAMRTLCDALESSWNHGSSPLGRLEAAIDQQDASERATIEQSAAKLSVKLLMPTGLCFLPAFVFLGIIPAVASFVM
ncbi:pilus assembly protein [Bifidobacterium goeldii]|uniref:Pilus assembly protein n=1 Tax=Bifidobacterium goeldii TaxID=2306975 RepID=A0A430FLB2_9BIFI|nr:type II secretion system F family protein [Bifidobacterium goeldii]RSX53636.1 pilus assembly protein [Bifidobacterium goeldii]